MRRDYLRAYVIEVVRDLIARGAIRTADLGGDPRRILAMVLDIAKGEIVDVARDWKAILRELGAAAAERGVRMAVSAGAHHAERIADQVIADLLGKGTRR